MPAAPVVTETNGSTATHACKDRSASRRLEGKVAIVTGGARGIGEATVRLFVHHGAKVIIADIEDALGIKLSTAISPSSAATYIHCDVGNESDVQNLITQTITLHGRLDILFNNAGILGSGHTTKRKIKSILSFDGDEFEEIMRVNVKGAALGIKHAARVMINQGIKGCIISTSSVAGLTGGLGPYSYTASKHAVVGLTKNAACELGRFGIRVNCISPFGVATPMLVNAWTSSSSSSLCGGVGGGEDDDDDVGGVCCKDDDDEMDIGGGTSWGVQVEKMEEIIRNMATLKGGATLRPKDIAEAALYLAGDESKYVNGHNLVVDGGYTTSKDCFGF